MSEDDSGFGVNVGIGVAGNVATAVVAFLGSIYLARELGPDAYGAFYLMIAFFHVCNNPAGGWMNAVRKRFTEVDYPAGEAVGALVLAVVGNTLAVALVTFVLADPLASWLGEESAPALFVVLFAGMLPFLVSRRLLEVTKHFGLATWYVTARDVGRVAMQATLLYLGYGLSGMVVGMVAANALLVPPMVWRIGVRPRWPSRSTLESLWSFARSSIPESFVGTALSRMDRLLLGALATTAAVGNYEIAMNVTMPAMFVAGVASNRLLGRVSELASRDAGIDREVRNVIASVSIVAVPIFFGALVIGDVLVVTIYSASYAQAGTFVAGLAFYRLLKSQETILRSTIDGLNRPDLNVRISTVVFALNLVLGVGLLLVVGPIGIVAATVVGEILAYGLRAAVLRRLTAVELLPRPLLAQVVAGGVMAIVVWAARQAVGVPSWPVVGLYVGLGAVCYFGVLTGISTEFRDTSRHLLRDVMASRQ